LDPSQSPGNKLSRDFKLVVLAASKLLLNLTAAMAWSG
jgi:hypothetical protein